MIKPKPLNPAHTLQYFLALYSARDIRKIPWAIETALYGGKYQLISELSDSEFLTSLIVALQMRKECVCIDMGRSSLVCK